MKPLTHGFTSPLRYPGGKGMLANFAKLVTSQNNLLDGHYVEIYAGGASIAWALLFEEYVQHVHINDLCKPIYAFWKSTLEHTDALCKFISDTSVTIDEWHRQKSVQANSNEHSILELGFSTFFLNRTNRSGILKGGVIGGKEQAGKWKIDARFNKDDLIARIQRIARYSNRISIYNCDAVDFIRNHLSNLPRRSLVYLDPPYYVKGGGLYENHYMHDDHVKVSKLVVSRIEQPWIVSYDNTPEITNIYKGFRNIQYDLSYSAQERYAGSEIMFFSKSLIIPAVKNPSRVKLPGAYMPALF